MFVALSLRLMMRRTSYRRSRRLLCSHCWFLQDTKKGKLRFYHGPIFWNYGYIPQTWEDPTVKHPEASRACRSGGGICQPMTRARATSVNTAV